MLSEGCLNEALRNIRLKVSELFCSTELFALPSAAINVLSSFLIRTHLLQAVLLQAVTLQDVSSILPCQLLIFQDPLLFQPLRVAFLGILQAGGRAPVPLPAGRLENGWHEDFWRDMDVVIAGVSLWGRDQKVFHVWRIHPMVCTDGSRQACVWRAHKYKTL